MKIETKCPICKGTGKILLPKTSVIALKKQCVKDLYDKGYGIRQIQKLLDYKSPRSVQHILNK